MRPLLIAFLAATFGLAAIPAQAQTNKLSGIVDRLTGAVDNPDEPHIDAASDEAISDPGSTAHWRNPATGHSGTVRVTGAYRNDNGYDCLNYRRVTATGAGRTAYEGAFCRQIFGWARASERQVSATPSSHAQTATPLESQPHVRRVQTLLVELGYAPGPVDGLEGPRTRAAIRAYQRDRGLRADGRATATLAERLERDGSRARPVEPPVQAASLRQDSVRAKSGAAGADESKGRENGPRTPSVTPRPPFPYPGTPLPHSPLPSREGATSPVADVLPPHDRNAPALENPDEDREVAGSASPDDRVTMTPLRPGLLAVADPPVSPAEASLARLAETGACAGCSLRETDLTDIELAKADLPDADLAGSDLEGVWADFADLRRVDLSGARLRDAKLWKSRMSGADLRGAVLDGADLAGADLVEADLRDATLRDADLRGADLSGARTEGADFRGARLGRTDLTGVDLSRAMLTPDALDNAVLCGTTVSGREIDTGCAAQTVEAADPPEIVAVPDQADTAK